MQPGVRPGSPAVVSGALAKCLNAPDFGNTVVMVCPHVKELVKFWNQFCMIYNFCEQIINISIRNSFCVEYIFQSSKFGHFFFDIIIYSKWNLCSSFLAFLCLV